jgi:hypothetical protein
MKIIALAAAAVAAYGCASMYPAAQYSPITMTSVAADSEYAPFRQKGTAVVEGQAFLTTRGGDVKKGAGRLVTLDPATTYSQEWYSRFGNRYAQFDAVPGDSLFARARRTTVADADGRFRFTDLAPGRYIVRTTVTWEVPTGNLYVNTMSVQGGIVSEIVEARNGETKTVMLNTVTAPAQ